GEALFNLLIDKRVDLILQGHEHGYARSRQLSTGERCPAFPTNRVDPACFADDATTDTYVKGQGPIVVIAGTLGINLRPMDPQDSEAGAFRAIMGSNLDRTHGFMKYTVTADRIQAQFVATTKGGFGDEFTIADPNPAQPTPLPPTASPMADAPAAVVPPGDAAPLASTLIRPTALRSGYWMLGADGAVSAFGEAARLDAVSVPAGRSAVDLEPTPTGNGAWVLDDTGAVTALGDAPALGGVAPALLGDGELPTSLSGTPSGQGYLVFTSRGRAVPFGDARALGDVAGVPLNGPVLDSVMTPSGLGYYMVASDGGIFAFGDARFA